MRMTVEMQSKYFKAEEGKETLHGVYRDDQKITTRTHAYRSGATFSGSWKGGLRHGQGTMVWPDGARYEGEW